MYRTLAFHSWHAECRQTSETRKVYSMYVCICTYLCMYYTALYRSTLCIQGEIRFWEKNIISHGPDSRSQVRSPDLVAHTLANAPRSASLPKMGRPARVILRLVEASFLMRWKLSVFPEENIGRRDPAKLVVSCPRGE